MKSKALSLTAILLAVLMTSSVLGGCNRTVYIDEEESNGYYYGDESETENPDNTDADTSTNTEDSSDSATNTDSKSGSTSQNGTGSKNNVFTQTSSKGTTVLPAGNWGGDTITIYGVWEGAFGTGTKAEDDTDKLYIAKRKELEQKYNCKIVYKKMNPNDTTAQIIVKVKAGTKVGDIINCQRIDLERSSLVTGILTDLNTVPNLNLKDSRWNQALIKVSTQNGVTYGANFGYGDVQSGFLVNLDLYNKVKSKINFDLFDVVNKKQWTWEKFIQLCQATKADLDSNNIWNDKDQYGATGVNQPTLFATILGDGMTILERQSNGKMKYTMNSQITKDTINYLRNNMVFNKSWHSFESGTAAANAFYEGRVLLYGVPLWTLDTIKEKAPKMNVGFVPAPLGNSGKVKNYINLGDSWAPVLCIPVTNKKPERAGIILSAFLELSDQSKELKLKEYKNEYFPKDANSMANVKNMLENTYYENYLIEFNQTPWSALSASLWNPQDTIETQLQAIDSQMISWVNTTYNK